MRLTTSISRRGAIKGSLAGLAVASLPSLAGGSPSPRRMNDRLTGDITPVHDPSIIRQADTYYVFCTTGRDSKGQIPIRTSKDLLHWTLAGSVFAKLPDWAARRIPGAVGIWAPDISFVNGKYCLYYAVSTFGSNRSAIGLATNATLDARSPRYKWVDQGLVFESFKTDSYNCIDPTHVVDREGGQWLAFGSFWGGIMLIKLDPRTGKPAPGDRHVVCLAQRPVPEGGPDAIEANYIIERGGYYYLFASYDYCCKGIFSTYYTAMGRSKAIAGPYLDRLGRPMTEGYGSVIVKADLQENGEWRGPGHCAILRDGGGRDYIVYHAYYMPKGARMDPSQWRQNHVGAPYLRIAPLVWSNDGWPAAVM